MKQLEIRINFPFIAKQPIYYNANALIYTPEKGIKYIEAVLNEIKNCEGEFPDYEITDVYFDGKCDIFGGSQYKKIIQALKNTFVFTDNTRIHFSIDPSMMSVANMDVLRDYGVSDILVNYRTANYDEHILLELPYPYSALDSMQYVLNLYHMPMGFELLYGIPGSTTNTLDNSIKGVLSANPKFVYVSPVLVKENMNLYTKCQKENIEILNETQIIEQFNHIKEQMLNNGYHQYGRYFTKETSNDIQPSNILGIGINSYTCLDNVYYASTNNYDIYCEHSDDLSVIASSPIMLNEKSQNINTILFELTQKGTMKSVPNKNILVENELLTEEENKIILTSKGITYLDEVVRIIQES